jgi:hypothetical protein
MPVVSKQDQVAIAQYLSERLVGRVGLEVWTRRESAIVLPDRDPATHAEDVVAVARELVSLHAGLTFTPYDLDRHASRAAEAGIDRSPTTVLRARGADLRFVGYYSGALFPALIDGIVMAGNGVTPASAASKDALASLAGRVTLEVLGAPYDPLSAHMLRVSFALGVESHQLRVVFTEIAESPILAEQRQVTEVPLVIINGRRFAGAFDEPELVEQIRRVASGDDEPVIRPRVLSMPYMSTEQARQFADELAAASEGAQLEASVPPPEEPGGLYIPGGRRR